MKIQAFLIEKAPFVKKRFHNMFLFRQQQGKKKLLLGWQVYCSMVKTSVLIAQHQAIIYLSSYDTRKCSSSFFITMNNISNVKLLIDSKEYKISWSFDNFFVFTVWNNSYLVNRVFRVKKFIRNYRMSVQRIFCLEIMLHCLANKVIPLHQRP